MNGVNAHDDFVELSNCMGILENMEAGVYSIVETQWDTTCPKFCKYIKETMKKEGYICEGCIQLKHGQILPHIVETRGYYAGSLRALGLQGGQYRQ